MMFIFTHAYALEVVIALMATWVFTAQLRTLRLAWHDHRTAESFANTQAEVVTTWTTVKAETWRCVSTLVLLWLAIMTVVLEPPSSVADFMHPRQLSFWRLAFFGYVALQRWKIYVEQSGRRESIAAIRADRRALLKDEPDVVSTDRR